MGAATVQAQIATGASPSYANAETGAKWNREDSLAGTTPVPIPTVTGTNFSWIKNFALVVTGTGTTTMSNRRVNYSGSPATGLGLFFKDVAVASYAQAASGNKPTDSGSNGATPAGYTAMSSSTQLWDNTSVSTGSTGVNGDLCVCVLGVDHTYSGGPGSAQAAPSLVFSYDEA